MAKKQYIRIVRKNKKNIRVELKDHSTLLIPIEEISNWKCVESKSKENVVENNKKENVNKSNGAANKVTNKKGYRNKTVENKQNKNSEKEDSCSFSAILNNLPKNILVENSYYLQKEHDKTIVGIDPSYSRTGIAILTKDGHVIFHTLSEQIGKKDFIHTYNSAYSLATQLKEYLKQFEPYEVVMEYAPPVSSMSPALYCLDALYHFVLHDSIKRLYHPMTLATIIGKKDRTKADSVLKGLSIMQELQSAGWQIDQKRKPCHDCFEALIYVDYFLKNSAIIELCDNSGKKEEIVKNSDGKKIVKKNKKKK